MARLVLPGSHFTSSRPGSIAVVGPVVLSLRMARGGRAQAERLGISRIGSTTAATLTAGISWSAVRFRLHGSRVAVRCRIGQWTTFGQTGLVRGFRTGISVQASTHGHRLTAEGWFTRRRHQPHTGGRLLGRWFGLGDLCPWLGHCASG